MKNRVFTPDFKLTIVKAVLNGEKTVMQLCREHNLSDSLIHNWKKLYRDKGEAAFTVTTQAHLRSTPATTPEEQQAQEIVALRNKVAELERMIGQQTVELNILKKVSEMINSSPSRNGAK
jgi:transposase-like protein